MCNKGLQEIYFLYICEGGSRLTFLEDLIEYKNGCAGSSGDLQKNEPIIYKRVFSLGCGKCFDELMKKTVNGMRDVNFEESKAFLNVLIFIQEVGARAMWKFNCDLSEEMENFVRDFDRLDVIEEQIRLYNFAKNYSG